MKSKTVVVFVLLICFFTNTISIAAVTKYPDYAFEFLGTDRWENFNRKMFNFNLGLNKYAIRPIHILWSSIMPEYGMDRIQSVTRNIEFPIRLVSSLIQRDFNACKTETVRFFTNTILGVGGMFDPAKSIFHIEPVNENMEQALAGCKMGTGKFFVCPVLSFTSLRGLLGRLLDTALNPGSYIATPVLAIIKGCMTVNKTSYMQPMIQMVESTYADPYDIAKKYYGLETYLRCANLDRIDISEFLNVPVEKVETEPAEKQSVAALEKPDNTTPALSAENLVKIEVSSEILNSGVIQGGASYDEIIKNKSAEDFKLNADIKLYGYNPQTPVIDSMRTALFDLPGVDESVWNELSVWNRSFSKRIKTSSVEFTPNRPEYKFRYLMQKDKTSPVAIIYPSVGEGIMSSHSVLLGKLFYDAGYSIIIQGSHFQWEFVKSMPEGYYPGLPSADAEILRRLSAQIIESLEKKYDCKTGDKVLIGTSFGAMEALFVGEKESKENTLGNLKIISICPPVELIYAMKQFDKNSQDWNRSPETLKQRVSLTAAKILKLYEMRNEKTAPAQINSLPFSDDEAKLITGFIMHQKLSDLIFTIEGAPKCSKCEIYNSINNMDFQDYTNKYLLGASDLTCDDLSYESSLQAISSYLENSNNYKIYHSLTDYLTNTNQLKKLKAATGNKTVLLDNGAHLGFLYREEFINDLKKTIALKDTEK